MVKIDKTKSFNEIFMLFLSEELEHRAIAHYNDSKLEIVTSKNSQYDSEVDK